MGTTRRPADMIERLHQIARLIEDGERERARALLEMVEQDLGPQDATVVAARWELNAPDLDSLTPLDDPPDSASSSVVERGGKLDDGIDLNRAPRE